LWQAKDGPGGLKTGIEELCRKAEEAVDAGVSYLLLSDRGVSAEHAPIPMLMAVGAVHHHLISKSKRMRASILVETGEAREDHHVACLISYGASVVYPYMAYEIAAELAVQRSNAASAAALEESEDSVASKDEKPASIEEALYNYRKALQDGLLRIMSKMGISTLQSYKGAQVFEALGLDDDVMER
jgi:hypothetical protein